MVKQGPPADAEERDPTPFLRPSLEMQRQDQTMPFDAKKSCWVPDEKEGFISAEIKGTKGETVTVTITGQGVRSFMKNNFYRGFFFLFRHFYDGSSLCLIAWLINLIFSSIHPTLVWLIDWLIEFFISIFKIYHRKDRLIDGLIDWELLLILSMLFYDYRKRPSRRIKSSRWIRPSSRNARTCPRWRTWTTRPSCTISVNATTRTSST